MNIEMLTKKQNGTFELILILVFLTWLAINIQAQKKINDQSRNVRDVRAALGKLVDGFNNRNLRPVLASFTKDAYILNPTRGVGSYQDLSEGLTKAYSVRTKNPFKILIEVEEIQTSGDLAFIRLIWKRERNDDKAIISKEKDLEIWRREADGQWRLARGYSFYFKEDYPLKPVMELNKTDRAADRLNAGKTPPNQINDVEAIKSALDKLVLAYNRRDLEAVISLFARDTLLSHEGAADTNREEARQIYSQMFNNQPSFPITISYQLEEIQTSGNLAFARVSWLVERNSDRKFLSRNKDLKIWQRQKDGSWKIVRGIGFYLQSDDKEKTSKE